MVADSESQVVSGTSRVAGERRIGGIAALFVLFGSVSLCATAIQGIGLLFPGANWTPHPSWRDFLSSAFLTAGCYGTSRLAEQRSRVWALVTAAWFATPFVGYLTGDPPGSGPVLLAVGGLATIASLWRHLNRA